MSERACKYCGANKGAKGIGQHEKACARKQAEAAQAQALFARRQEAAAQAVTPEAAPILETGPDPRFTFNHFDFNDFPEPEPELGPHDAESEELDIRYEFHPHSGLDPEHHSLEDYLRLESSRQRLPSTDEQPWLPFRTRLDFEVSEFAQENMLNRAATNKLLSLIRRCGANLEEFTIRNWQDMNKQWDAASKKCTDFEMYKVEVPYKNTLVPFKMHARPLWNWAMDLIRDPCLAKCFVWDAVKMNRHNGKSFVRFWNEPWTADAFWELQSRLPKDISAKLFPFYIYADKSKLSSFGTQKAHPIIVRVLNIITGIRNSSEWGGGQVVGELPIIDDDTAESGKTGYVNFKHAMWHAAFYKLLESIALISKTGAWTTCGDGEKRWLFPCIVILSADYEEAAIMTLIRGVMGNNPCPVCLIKRDEQSDINIVRDLRTAAESQKAVKKARAGTVEAGEDLLKDLGLRKIDNVFWIVANSDPHRAISFDRLHSHHSGLWGDHLFSQLKIHLKELGDRQSAKLDQQFDALPRWRGLNHFKAVTNISFNDGSKHEDIAKMMVFAAHNILTAETDKIGVLLLACIRSYLELDMYAGLELHTADTIADGRRQLQKFDQSLKKYRHACKGTDFADKNWNFPKAHLHQHLFDDIERKGVTRNFNTKISEPLHRPLRDAYHNQTNFKNVQPQILRSVHRRMVGKYIREQLGDLDQFLDDDELPENLPPADLEVVGNVVVGSKLPAISFSALEAEMKNDAAFTKFRIRFAEFLNVFLPAYGYPLPHGKRVVLVAGEEIIPYQFLKVFFKSLENWLDDVDFLRCNPCFHGLARYDAALVKTMQGNIFVRLVYVFTFEIDGRRHPVALVQALDVGIPQRLYRVRQREREKCEFISVHSIIRGALLIPDFEIEGDHLVVDIVDADMYLRIKAMYGDRE
ncbi:hypothetical protein DFH08DRAFT_921182 [Mycena albidolilacea]|uniref:Uncharacterized protein n=1 Tax=Mycena albidolilacea TaxID=1033008 RepID=A0AAD7AJJ5_9AGAR|nr:hypothetical protein DFH08DRAFT_921182 [Mycena albidolilacea]